MRSAPGPSAEQLQEPWSHLEHFVLQFDFPVLLLLWVEVDVVQVPVGRGTGFTDQSRHFRMCYPKEQRSH